jgi:hypothetical protein
VSFFIDDLLLVCRDQQEITHGRGRVANKNDQCVVERKKRPVVRQVEGYDRFEREPVYQQLAELYWAMRLYVGFFHPSIELW